MMGKTQRFSKGYASGFVPEYRHAVETVGETEGFGSSSRVGSEDSSAPKRKCISLNMDVRNSFNVPSQVLSVSQMSKSRRKEEEMRLRGELQQVQSLQKMLLSRNAACVNNGALSSSGGGQLKKQNAAAQNGPSLKRGNSGRFESAKQVPQPPPVASHKPPPPLASNKVPPTVKSNKVPPPVASNKVPPPMVSNSIPLLMKQCDNLLKWLLAHSYAWVFKEPVDVVKLNIPDYFQVIKHPMDFGTIKSKLNSGSYSSPLGFASDVRLTFTNAMTYNPPGNDVHVMAETMKKLFESKWKHIEKKLVPADANAKRQTETLKPVSQPKKRKISPVYPETKASSVYQETKASSVYQETKASSVYQETKASSVYQETKASSVYQEMKTSSVYQEIIQPEHTRPKMTEEERHNLGRQLESFTDMPDTFVDFFRRHTSNVNQTSEDEIEIDIDSLGDDTLFELKKLLDDYSRGKQSIPQTAAEPCEVEILNESGLSNSSMHAGKGNEQADEDVDIGGNDPPVSSYPPVVIDKDAMLRSGRHSSSSSSSSDSGSSSSDSDSSSSSGSESDAKVSPRKDNKESVSYGANSVDEKNVKISHTDRNRSSDALDQLEQNAYPKPESVEADHSKDGENAPSERQVSPDKLYRAALLRSRFADTILKAREKTLDQVDKKDPEKLRHEREELERLQREERARLQAEAKVAEELRKQAEAEAAAQAAAEVKRKRELEREAARQALLQMEKTVEINESSIFLKDLEMLRTVPGEQLPSSVGETSPSHSQDGIGGFSLGGTNPLEQLGLYMKVDEDEEEEVEPAGARTNDVEEGEID